MFHSQYRALAISLPSGSGRGDSERAPRPFGLRAQCGAEAHRTGGLSLHRPGRGSCGNGQPAVSDPAGVSSHAGPVRCPAATAAGGASTRSALRPLAASIAPGADGLCPASPLRPAVRLGGTLALMGGGARNGHGAQRGRIRRSLDRRSVQLGAGASVCGRASEIDARKRHPRVYGHGDGRRRTGQAPAGRPGGPAGLGRPERTAEHRDLWRVQGAGAGAGDPAFRGYTWSAARGVARLPLAADRAGFERLGSLGRPSELRDAPSRSGFQSQRPVGDRRAERSRLLDSTRAPARVFCQRDADALPGRLPGVY